MIAYTVDDMKALAECSSSELAALLESIDYDPNEFERMLQGIPKDHHFLFAVPFVDLPEHMDNDRLMGYINFRFKVGK